MPRRSLPLAFVVLALAALALLAGLLAWLQSGTREGPPGDPLPAAAAPRASTGLELSAGERSAQREVSEPAVAPPPAPSEPGTSPEPPSSPAPLAGLRVQLLDTRGKPESGAHYLLTPMTGGHLGPLRRTWIERTSDEQGRIEVQPLEPGPWRLRCSATNRATFSFDLVLRPGWNELEPIVFPERVIAGDVSVLLESAGRRTDLGGVLQLRSLDGDHDDRWNRVGRGAGVWRRPPEPGEETRFTFHGLPPGRYRVAFFPDGFAPADAEYRDTSVPGDEVVFRVLDDVARRPLRFRVRDAASGAELAQSVVVLLEGRRGVPRAQRLERGMPAAETCLEHVPRWVVLAEGYLPRTGDRGAAREEADGLVVDVALERGLGCAVLARDADEMLAIPGVGHESGLRQERLPGLAGVELLVAGRAAARTEAQGLALVELGSPSARFELRSPGRVLAEAQGWEPGLGPEGKTLVQVWFATDR